MHCVFSQSFLINCYPNGCYYLLFYYLPCYLSDCYYLSLYLHSQIVPGVPYTPGTSRHAPPGVSHSTNELTLGPTSSWTNFPYPHSTYKSPYAYQTQTRSVNLPQSPYKSQTCSPTELSCNPSLLSELIALPYRGNNSEYSSPSTTTCTTAAPSLIWDCKILPHDPPPPTSRV